MTFAGAVITGVLGAATVVTEVLADLLLSSVEVAVMVAEPAVAGAVQAPVLALMVPAVAVQVRALVMPPVAVALKVVVLATVLVALAGLMAPTLMTLGLSLIHI